jgi:hypothetical protein
VEVLRVFVPKPGQHLLYDGGEAYQTYQSYLKGAEARRYFMPCFRWGVMVYDLKKSAIQSSENEG